MRWRVCRWAAASRSSSPIKIATKTPDMLHAFGKAVDHLGGRYVTAEDVGMNVADMIEVARATKFVAGLPNSARRRRRRSRTAHVAGCLPRH